MGRVTWAVLLLAVLLGACGSTRTPVASRPTATHQRTPHTDPPPSGTPTAAPAIYGKRVGALFAHDTSRGHFCTASPVDSPNRNLIITAAHCINSGKGRGYINDLVFVPGYRDGNAPYGVWKIKSLLVDQRWANSSDPDLDVGFAVLEPLNGKNIADVLGANLLGVNQGFDNVVRITGYPIAKDEPVSCVNRTSQQWKYQMRFDCHGYAPGTSGSPWLTHYDPKAHRGEVIGVIGGYHAGGKTDSVSYSSYFDDDVRRLYEEAVRESLLD